MNYQQTYDPMQASAMRQQNNAMLAQGIKSGISNVGNILEKHIEYKKFLAKNKTAKEAKAKLYQSVLDSLREAQVEPSNFRELTNAVSDIENNDISVAQFFANIAKPAEVAKETIVGRKNIANQPLEVQDPMSKIKGVGDVAPEMPNTMYVPGTQPTLGPAPNYSPSGIDTAVETMSPFEAKPIDIDPFTENSKSTVKYYTELMNKGMMPVGSAERLHAQLAANKDKSIELEREKEKTKQAEIKAEIARIQKSTEDSGEKIVEARVAGYQILSKATGKPVEVSVVEAKKHPELFVISNADKPRGQPWNLPSGGAGAKETEIDLQDLVRKNLQTVYRQDIVTVNMPKIDSFGEPVLDANRQPIMIPTKVPKADYLFKKLVSNRGEWERYVWDNYPDYAKKFGWGKPAPTNDDPEGLFQ